MRHGSLRERRQVSPLLRTFATAAKRSTTINFPTLRRYAAIPSPLVCAEPDAIKNAIGYAKFFSRSHDAVIRVYDEAGNVIETHEHTGDFKEW